MNQEIINRVYLFSEELQLHYAAPNKNLITEIMQFNASELSSLSSEQLYSYIFVLGQYLVLLQYNENLKNIEYKLSLKSYEFDLNSLKFELEGVVGKTVKERDAWILRNNPNLKALHDSVLALEAEKTLVEGMVRAVDGLLNALKKEASRRSSE